jgi:hypothetical protein
MSKVKVIISSVVLLFSLLAFATAADFTYEIIKTERRGDIKCMLTVTLSERISEQQLRRLALELRSKETKQYDRMFITYYLSGMEIGAGAWATSHFNPDLDVRILGMTAEEEKSLLTDKTKAAGKIIGVWIDDFLGKVTIVQKGSEHIINKKYKDGSASTEPLIGYKVQGKPAFKEEGNTLGEYYIIEESGELGVYDSLGLIKTMPAVK